MKDLVFHQVKIDQTSPNLELIIGVEIEVKNQDLVVTSLRLVQEIVEQIVLSLAAIINL